MIPQVAIVGRPNVGKSSLFNLLAQRRISIVDPTAGVTRDRISTVVELIGESPKGNPKSSTHPVELIDTGGYGIEDPDDLTSLVERQIAAAVSGASLILLIVDAQTGIVPLDEQVARLLRTSDTKTPVLLVANKVDGPSHEADAHEASRLGFGSPMAISATSGRNKALLMQAMIDRLDDALDPTTSLSPTTLLAIAGKRNAGKSTFVNALAGQERVIVSEIEGTTRDSVDVRFEIDGKAFTAIDTAGVRRTKSLAGDIEYYSYHRTLRSIRRADVVMLLIDATVPISQVDRHLATEILKHYKPCLIALNKWDLAQSQYTQDEYIQYLDGALKGLKFAPIVFTSSLQNEGLRECVAMAMNLHQQASHRVSTSELNRVMEQILSENTPTSKIGRHPKIYYVTQLETHPPTIGLFVNDPAMFDPAYKRFLVNRFRDLLPFSEIPIKLLIRGKKSLPLNARTTHGKTDLEVHV